MPRNCGPSGIAGTARRPPSRQWAAAPDRCNTLDDDQAESPTVIPLAGKADFADYMVIASGSSARKVGAMAEHIVEKLKKMGLRDLRTEGQSGGDWVLIDAGDVVVHLFRPEVREYYALEKLWEAENGAMADARLVLA